MATCAEKLCGSVWSQVCEYSACTCGGYDSSVYCQGLAYVGVGWVVWRDRDLLPKELIFELHYLGSTEFSFSLNFSRPAAPIIAQYFNFINLGYEGYRRIALNDLKNARLLSNALDKSGYYHVVSEIHKAPGGGEVDKKEYDNVEAYAPGLPVVAFRFSDEFQKRYPHIQQVSQTPHCFHANTSLKLPVLAEMDPDALKVEGLDQPELCASRLFSVYYISY